jgi:hypothetical protein
MRALLLLLLLAAPAAAPEGAPAFERLKKLEGNWHAKDGQTLAVRLINGGEAVLETVGLGADRGLASVALYRLEGGELLATHDGEAHAVLRFLPTTAETLRFEARAEPGKPAPAGLASVTLTVRDAETLRRVTVLRVQGKEVARAVDYTREYLDTLK